CSTSARPSASVMNRGAVSGTGRAAAVIAPATTRAATHAIRMRIRNMSPICRYGQGIMPQPRSLLITILALVLVAVGVGAPMTSIPVLTHAVALAMPGALAIPIGVPPVWLPGGEPLLMWA